jgi:hypothetical protein
MVRASILPATTLLLTAALVATTGPAQAAAPPGVILSDLESAPDQRELAGSLDLLLRSLLGRGQRALVPTRELSLALEVLSQGRRREVLLVDPAQAKGLMERLGADRTVIGKLTVTDTRWEVRGVILGPEGDRLSSVAAQVPPGELNQLARQVAERLSVRMGLTVLDRPPVSLESLRPYARAQAQMNSGDPRAAANTLALADPRPSTSVASAKEVVDSLAGSPGLAPPARMQMSLLSGDYSGAKQTADEILKAEPGNVQARAGKVRALTGQGDLERAVNEFDGIKTSKDPFAAAANVALLVKRRYSPDRKALADGKLSEEDQAQALVGSLDDPDSDARPVLAFMSGAPPNALPGEVENAAVGAAERTAGKDPGLAASVAGRALKGGVQVDRALPLVQVHKLEKGELAAVKEHLDQVGPKAEKVRLALGQELELREGAAQKLRLGGLDVSPADTGLEALAAQLRGVLSNFGVLHEQVGHRVLVVSKQDTAATWYLPFQVRRTRLEHGTWRAVWDKPFEMSLVSPEGVESIAAGNLTEAFLETLLEQRGADLVVVLAAQPRGTKVEVEIILFDGASSTAYRTSGRIDGLGSGILSINILPFGLALLVLVIPVVLVRMWRRAGEVTVRVMASDATEKRLCVLLSQSGKPPRVPDAKAWAEEFDSKAARPKKVKFFARVEEATTSFERVPPGRWWAHFYGTYKTGKIAHVVTGEEYSQAIEVRKQDITTVSFSLTVSSAEFHVTVQDKKNPSVGALVWLDDDRDKAIRTDAEGLAVLKVGMGQHMLRVEAAGMLVEKQHVVVKRKAHVLTINLDWERKRDDVSRALDNDPDVIAARTGSTGTLPAASVSGTMPAQSSSATLPAQSSSATLPAQNRTGPQAVPARPAADASVSLPPEFLPPSEDSRPLNPGGGRH